MGFVVKSNKIIYISLQKLLLGWIMHNYEVVMFYFIWGKDDICDNQKLIIVPEIYSSSIVLTIAVTIDNFEFASNWHRYLVF